jgi:hypothetical protein
VNLTYPINIFQYHVPVLKKNKSIKENANYLINRLQNQVSKKTANIKDLLERIRILEQNQTNTSPMSSIPTTIDNTEKTPETRGLEQHVRDVIVKTENDKQKMDELIKKSNRSIISISSIFPWNFFPNTIDVEESRVTFIFRQLFASQSHSVDIKDISNVFIESGILFSTLQVVSRTFIQNEIKIEFLKKRDAVRTKDIIEGLRTFAYHDIDTSTYEIGDLVTKLKELNTTKSLEQ